MCSKYLPLNFDFNKPPLHEVLVLMKEIGRPKCKIYLNTTNKYPDKSGLFCFGNLALPPPISAGRPQTRSLLSNIGSWMGVDNLAYLPLLAPYELNIVESGQMIIHSIGTERMAPQIIDSGRKVVSKLGCNVLHSCL